MNRKTLGGNLSQSAWKILVHKCSSVIGLLRAGPAKQYNDDDSNKSHYVHNAF